MAKRKSFRGAAGANRATAKLGVVQTDDGSWRLKHPRCARACREDLEEVEQMIAGGEMEIATDELRWLLSECHNFLAAHKLLGDLALAAGDMRLARGHFGYAYQLGIKAIDGNRDAKHLPYATEQNQAFFQAGRGLATCLMKLNKRNLASDVIQRLVQLDPRDPLALQALLNAPQKDRKKKR